jgi:hypothetical protein
MDELAAMRERAQKIIDAEKKAHETDDPDNVSLFAFRLLRVKTAEEILGVGDSSRRSGTVTMKRNTDS